jgi:serpin B
MDMKKWMWTAVVPLVGCALVDDPKPSTPAEMCSESTRSAESLSEDDLNAVADANDFAIAFHRGVAAERAEENLFHSPFSFTTALGMTYAGAANQTREEMRNALNITSEDPVFHAAIGGLSSDLQTTEEDCYELRVANRVFGQADYPWSDSFLDTLDLDYGSSIRLLDIAGNSEAARAEINGWVEDQTEDHITDLLPPGSMDSATKMVLANAIYFKGDWEIPFDRARTSSSPFVTPTGEVSVDMMALAEGEMAPFFADPELGVSGVVLPYQGGDISMVLVLPDLPEGLPELEQSFEASDLQRWNDTSGEVELALPKFEFTSVVNDGDVVLADRGMVEPFIEGVADFSNMVTGDQPLSDLWIAGIYHKGFIRVDEEGTEAAAATGVVIGLESAAPSIRFDRSFLFLIQDNLSGQILFMGHVIDPTL